MVEREFGDEFIHAHHLGVVAWIPAEKGEEIHHSLGNISAFAVSAGCLTAFRVVPQQREHGKTKAVAVALAQLALSVGLEQQRQMHEFGHRVGPTESFVEKHMQRRARQPLLATNNVRDLHEMVIDYICQMVGGQVVGTLIEHLVVEDVAFNCHKAADTVVDLHITSRIDFEPHNIFLPVGNHFLHFFSG